MSITVTNNVKFHSGQLRAMKIMLQNPVKYNIIKCSRQSGKTSFVEVMASYFTIQFKKKTIWTSPTIPQSKKVYRELKEALPKHIIIKTLDSERRIELKNGSIIIFLGVEKPDNLVGDNADLFILDEFALYKPEVWNKLKPFLISKKDATCIIVSTPRGPGNYFHRMFMKGLENNGRYRSYEWNYLENPYCDLLEIEDAREELPDALFRQEYLGEFVKDGSSVFANIELCANIHEFVEPYDSLTYYNGNDLAKQKDYTVSTTMNEKCEVVNIYRTNKQDWNIIVDGVVNQLNLYKPKLALFEVNGVGDPTFDFVRKKYSKVTPFVMTNQHKQIIISQLIQGFNRKLISIPTKELFPTLHEQLNAFSFTYSKEKRQIVYAAADGYHDDDVISLALANNAWYRFHGRK